MPTLGYYLSKIYGGKYDNRDSQQNRRVRFKQDPQLDASRTNVILYYRGSFNPPHRGHMAVLWHAYYQLAKSLNVVAAFIRLNNDEGVQRKCEEHGGNRALSKEHRTRLWMEDPRFPPWAWIKEDDTDSETLLRNIRKHARKDGYRVQFADLWYVSPEHQLLLSHHL